VQPTVETRFAALEARDENLPARVDRPNQKEQLASRFPKPSKSAVYRASRTATARPRCSPSWSPNAPQVDSVSIG
jgi:hypothetical protein